MRRNTAEEMNISYHFCEILKPCRSGSRTHVERGTNVRFFLCLELWRWL